MKPSLSIIAIVVVVALTIFAIYITPTSSVIVYDCRLAEISPDIPVKAKEQCRKLQAK